MRRELRSLSYCPVLLLPLVALAVLLPPLDTVAFTIKGWSTSCTCGGNDGRSSLGIHVMITLPHVGSIFAISACACSGLNSGIIGSALSSLSSSLCACQYGFSLFVSESYCSCVIMYSIPI